MSPPDSYTTLTPSVSEFTAPEATSVAGPQTPPVRTDCITSQAMIDELHCSQTTTLPFGATAGFCAVPVPELSCTGAPPARSTAYVEPTATLLNSIYATVVLPIAAPMRLLPAIGATSLVLAAAASNTMIELPLAWMRVKTMRLPLTSDSRSRAPAGEATA